MSGMELSVGASLFSGFSPAPTAHVAPCTISPLMVTASEARPSSEAESAQESSSMSMGTLFDRAVCWRSAVRKKPGLSSSCRLSGFVNNEPLAEASCQPEMAAMRTTTCFIHLTGASDPSHSFSHRGGRTPSMRQLPSFLVVALSSSVPRTTRPMAPSDASTHLSSACALTSSSATKPSTGAAEGSTRGLAPRTFSHVVTSFCQRARMGESACAHFSRSKTAEEPVLSMPSVRRLDCTALAARFCTATSALAGSPKTVGESLHGIDSMTRI
mmetsp:Transcript_5128/g.16956  ORF Transcript_5128/g.16956 Transcript_5128/m.16956 type:complete len:271 (+) Transcript_5128:440-1252(+)